MKRWEWRLLGALTLLSLAIHFYFRIRGFGEQDEARLGLYALDWRAHGVFATDTYLNRTSPLYLMLLGYALDHGLSPGAISHVLNLVNVLFGSLALVPMFLLFRELARDGRTAFLAVVAYWFAPAFWYGQGYGMPHIPSLAFFLTSLYAFARALTDGSREHAHPATGLEPRWLAVAAVTSALAGALKSDIVLSGLAFPALVPCLGAPTVRRLLVACALPAVGVAAALFLSHAFLPVGISTFDFAASWNQQFPFDWRALVDRRHWLITERALGSVFWVAAAAGFVGLLRRADRSEAEIGAGRRLVLLCVAWALPTVLFWGLIWAHAARHLAAALVPVALVTVAGWRELLGAMPRVVAAVAGMLVVNYFSAPATNHPHLAAPRLFASRDLMQALTDEFTKSGEEFARARAPRKLLLGAGAVPYCEFAVIAQARRFERRVNKPGELWDLDVASPGGPELVRIRRGPQPTPERADPGWFAWNAERGGAP